MKILFVMAAIFLLNGCTDTEEINNPNLRIRNNSSQNISIKCYIKNVLEINEEIKPNTLGRRYPVSSATIGFGAFDSITIKFTDTKGYLCSKLASELCFPHRPSPLANDINDFVKEGENYIYDITEEDYQNAFDL
jgi:hypothetical protein